MDDEAEVASHESNTTGSDGRDAAVGIPGEAAGFTGYEAGLPRLLACFYILFLAIFGIWGFRGETRSRSSAPGHRERKFIFERFENHTVTFQV